MRNKIHNRNIWHMLRPFCFLLPAIIGLLLYWILPNFPSFTETVFSRGLFRLISVPLGWLTSQFPFSFAELLTVLALPAAVVLLILFIIRMIRSDNRRHTAARVGKAIGWIASCIFLAYMFLHGLNYYRLCVPDLMNLDTSLKTPEFLQSVCIDLAQKASAERENVQKDTNGCMKLSTSISNTLKHAGDGYSKLDDKYSILWGTVNHAKPVQLSHWWSYTGITGVYFPLLTEANVNIDQPDYAIPMTAAHELAHTRGFAREDECNFFACLSCINHPSADYRYSGYYMAYIYCSNALYNYDKGLWKAANEYCSDGMINDMRHQNEYWKQFEGEVQKTADSINNSFIKAQGVEDGVLSYDRMVELVLAYYEKEGLI